MNDFSYLRGRTLLAVGCAVATLVACAPQEQAAPPAPTPEPPPAGISVSMSTELDAAPADVWKVVGDFGALDKFLEVVESLDLEGEGVGSVRTLNLPEGAKVIETLHTWDAEAMSYSYSIDESPMPIEGYTATLTVSALEDGGAKVDWSSEFKAIGASDADARKSVTGIYEMGFAGLKKLFPDKVGE